VIRIAAIGDADQLRRVLRREACESAQVPAESIRKTGTTIGFNCDPTPLGPLSLFSTGMPGYFIGSGRQSRHFAFRKNWCLQ
jgi:hypothetical protein